MNTPEFGAKLSQETKRPIDNLFSILKNDVLNLRHFWSLFIGFFLISLIASHIYNDGILDGILKYTTRTMKLMISTSIMFVFVFAFLSISFVFMRNRKNSDATFLISFLNHVKPYLPSSMSTLRVVIAFISFPILMGCFVYWKEKIGQFNAYDWDVTFAQWDYVLFFGNDAWEVLHPFIGIETITRSLDFIYYFWIIMCVIWWVFVFTSKSLANEIKHQYLLATLLSWVFIGLFAATFFASGGPVYYDEFTGDGQRYSELMLYLQSFGFINQIGEMTDALRAVRAHEYLWQVHIGQLQTPGGISAMPSMHNAQAVLFVLVAYSFSRLIGHLMLIHAIIIFIGSIHLAWHYAVDGIVCAPMVITIWYIAGRMTGTYKTKNQRRP